jgi:hypothetical protein
MALEVPVTIKGKTLGQEISTPYVETDLQLFPPFPKDPPVTKDSWVWASITELDVDSRPHLGDAVMWVANVVPEDDGSIWVRVLSSWPNDLPGLIRLLFWATV